MWSFSQCAMQKVPRDGALGVMCNTAAFGHPGAEIYERWLVARIPVLWWLVAWIPVLWVIMGRIF